MTHVLSIIALFGALVLTYVSIVFLIALLRKDNSIMDIAYGPAFAITGLATLYLTESYSPLPILMVVCICLWATRLSVRIFLKNLGTPEDPRYAAWRTEWMKRGKRYFILRSYLQVYLLQGTIITLVAIPLCISIAAGDALMVPVVAIGLIIFCVGLGFETIADMQLDHFIKRKQLGHDVGTFMQDGLFRYSRRPNYFGESLVWLGLATMTLSLPFGVLALISPLLITYIMTRVTGPMLEKQMRERYAAEYREYMAHTSYFFPLPPRV